MGVETYRPADVTVVFAGIPLNGFVEGEFITAVKNSDAYNLNVGSTGKGARAQNADESGRVTIRLQQTAPENGLLSALHEIDKATGNGVGPFSMKDLSGLDAVAAESMWIVKVPDMTEGNEISGREWILESDNLRILLGGNPSA